MITNLLSIEDYLSGKLLYLQKFHLINFEGID